MPAHFLLQFLNSIRTDNVHDLEMRHQDFRNIKVLARKINKVVTKVEHLPTGTVMVKKTIFIDQKPSIRKQILRELHIRHECISKYIVLFFGAYLKEPDINICMEFMDKGSLDVISKECGVIDIGILGKVAYSVLEGLAYLNDTYHLVHRDIMPSHILCNSLGEFKICSFGASGELINSFADTFVGTPIYMSPERIQGFQYTITADVWSLGITLVELALGHFPYFESSSQGPLPTGISIAELMVAIVHGPNPRLNGSEIQFPEEAVAFVDSCLLKDPGERKMPRELLDDVWIQQSKVSDVDLEGWTASF